MLLRMMRVICTGANWFERPQTPDDSIIMPDHIGWDRTAWLNTFLVKINWKSSPCTQLNASIQRQLCGEQDTKGTRYLAIPFYKTIASFQQRWEKMSSFCWPLSEKPRPRFTCPRPVMMRATSTAFVPQRSAPSITLSWRDLKKIRATTDGSLPTEL